MSGAPFTDAQMRRYSRHILLPDVGGRGQARLLAATVSVEVGGPAGRIAAAYLAAAGVGTVCLVGPERAVEARDAVFPLTLDDVGHALVPALAARLAALNPDVRIDGPARGASAVAGARCGEGLGAEMSVADAFACGGEAAARLLHRLAVAP